MVKAISVPVVGKQKQARKRQAFGLQENIRGTSLAGLSNPPGTARLPARGHR